MPGFYVKDIKTRNFNKR